MEEKKIEKFEQYQKLMQSIIDKCTEENFVKVYREREENDRSSFHDKLYKYYIIDGLHVYLHYTERNEKLLDVTISKEPRGESYYDIQYEKSPSMKLQFNVLDYKDNGINDVILKSRTNVNSEHIAVKNLQGISGNEKPFTEILPMRRKEYSIYRSYNTIEYNPFFAYHDSLKYSNTELNGNNIYDIEMILEETIKILTEYLQSKKENDCLFERDNLALLKETLEFYKSIERVSEKEPTIEKKQEEISNNKKDKSQDQAKDDKVPESRKIENLEENIEILANDETKEITEKEKNETNIEDKKLDGFERYQKWIEEIIKMCTEKTLIDIDSENDKNTKHFAIEGVHVYISYNDKDDIDSVEIRLNEKDFSDVLKGKRLNLSKIAAIVENGKAKCISFELGDDIRFGMIIYSKNFTTVNSIRDKSNNSFNLEEELSEEIENNPLINDKDQIYDTCPDVEELLKDSIKKLEKLSIDSRIFKRNFK